ncbi:MAG: hypothetical protein ACRDY3_12560 [Acidimicrobiales bacterium]
MRARNAVVPVPAPYPSVKLVAIAHSGTSAASDLLAEAALPPGAQPLAAAPTGQLGIEPESFLPYADRFDAHRFFSVPATPASVMAFVRQHLPTGWYVNGPQIAPPPGDALMVVRVPGHGAHLQEGAVTYEATPSGSGAALRVDGVVVWNPSRPSDEAVPGEGPVVVTGYHESGLVGGPTGAATARVNGRQARRLRRAFDALPLASPVLCMESETAYSLRFARVAGSPAVSVVEFTCPGSVDVTSGGTRMAPLLGDCTLLRLVAAALPPHAARYTHERASGCEPPMP